MIDMIVANNEKASQRKVLHVRSISKWAPACIGPYSQACFLEDGSVAFLAGMIGLDPSSMTLISRETERETITAQFLCSMLFVDRVLEAIGFGSCLGDHRNKKAADEDEDEDEDDHEGSQERDEIRDVARDVWSLETFPWSFDGSDLLNLTIYVCDQVSASIVLELCGSIFGSDPLHRVCASCLLPLASCLLPLASCLLPLASSSVHSTIHPVRD